MPSQDGNIKIVESFITSNKVKSLNNKNIYYNEHSDEVLIRYYQTLIAVRKGKSVRILEGINNYSASTNILVKLIERIAKEHGCTVSYVKQFAKGGGLKNKAKYIPNRLINEIEVERNGRTTTIDGADLLDGAYVKKNVKFAKGSTIGKNRYKVAFYLTQSDDTLQSAIISAEDEKEAKYKVTDLVKDLYGDYLDYEVTEVVKYAKGSTLPTFEKLPKNRQANKKYKYFAVGKDDGKIVNGWEIVSDLESLKYYAKGDLKDMDLKPSDFKIISKERLMRSGINPFDYDNWRKIDFSNDMPYIPKAKKGTNIKGKKSNGGIKIESYLPIFNGFYNTLFEANEEMYIEDPYDYDDYEFNYKQYHLDVAKECVGAIEQELNHLGLGISIKFQALDSPKEYNFRNDRIDVEYTLGADSLNKIHSYLLENKDAFSEYVKENYTSRSGFYSFHSNNVNEWLDNIKNGTDLDHKLGAVLNFILQNENYTDSDLYDRIIGNVYLEADLKESSKGKEYAEGGVIPNQKTDTNFDSYTAVGYAEGFIEAPSMEAQIEAWAYLIATKQAYSLQGWFGRQAESLIGNGIIARDGTIDWNKVYDMSDEQFANGGNTSSGFGYSIGGL
jgi:hypothetical protein